MKTDYDDTVKEWFPLINGNIMLKLFDHDGVDDNSYGYKNISRPCPLGSFILSHSKRLMNDVVQRIDGFKNNKIYGKHIYTQK